MERTFWTADKIADEIGMKRETVLRKIVSHPTFPKRIKIPNSNKYIWVGDEVVEWLKKYQEA